MVPGDADQDEHVLHEVGRSAGHAAGWSFLWSGSTLAVTGTTIISPAATRAGGTPMNVMVVPARGGIGRSLETQANTIACEIARRLGGHHRMMHLPDLLDEQALNDAQARKSAKPAHWNGPTPRCTASAADEMAASGCLSTPAGGAEVLKQGAVSGLRLLFRPNGKMWCSSASTVVARSGQAEPDLAWIAVAAGTGKAEAIDGAMRAEPHRMLVTDEGAPRSGAAKRNVARLKTALQ